MSNSAPIETRKLPPRKTSRRVTMAEVGRIAGVTQVTVSRALSDPTKVSPDTLARIRNAIEMTGFVPNAVAGALVSRRSRLISALVPSITNIVYSSTIHAFGKEMRQHGYEILLSETGFDPEEEADVISAHLSRQPDAMLLTGIHHTSRARKMLLAADIPVVEIWDVTETPLDLCVGFSHAEAGRNVAEVARESGHTRAANVTAGDERALRRAAAFSKAFGGEVAQVVVRGTASVANGRQGLAQLIAGGFDAGIVFCSSDIIALGVLIEAQARGIAVPDSLEVVGFGDQDFAADTYPALTTVQVDRNLLGRTAARALLERFEGRQAEHPTTNIGFKIIKRASARLPSNEQRL